LQDALPSFDTYPHGPLIIFFNINSVETDNRIDNVHGLVVKFSGHDNELSAALHCQSGCPSLRY
ncbi:hypothetical protein ACUOFC_36765, partial [Escherichia sp. TWPC-MK]